MSAFLHHQHAHCESGVTANLLNHEGIVLSEPMAFGIGAGLFFGHFPFIKVSGIPGTTFRIWPGYIFKRVTQRLGIKIEREQFRNPQKGMEQLDNILRSGKPVGMLSGVYYLDYLPEAFRFHFNAHNLVVYGKEDGQYQVSDPILESTTVISPEALVKARFAKGFPEPKGKMYYVLSVPEKIDLPKAIRAGIKQTCFFMLSPPINYAGVNAIHLLANRIANYPTKLSPRQAVLYLGNIIRMQEEIGTGGGGFRYLYAAFLQEAGQLLQRDELMQLSEVCTQLGDQWRHFAYNTARICKARTSDLISFQELSQQLHTIGDQEAAFYRQLKALKW